MKGKIIISFIFLITYTGHGHKKYHRINSSKA